MLSGIGLCTMVGTSRRAIVAAYVLLSVIDIFAIYLEIRAVVFTVLNHERTHLLVRDYVASGSDPAAMRRTLKTGLPILADGIAVGGGGDADGGGGGGERASPRSEQGVESESAEEPLLLDAAPASEDEGKALLSSPSTVSRRENIFLASRLSTNAFKTWSQVRSALRDSRSRPEGFVYMCGMLCAYAIPPPSVAEGLDGGRGSADGRQYLIVCCIVVVWPGGKKLLRSEAPRERDDIL